MNEAERRGRAWLMSECPWAWLGGVAVEGVADGRAWGVADEGGIDGRG